MWKKTWLIGILMAATALSGCSCGTTPGRPDSGNVADGGQDGGDGTNTDGGDGGNVDPGDGGVTVTSLTLSPANVTLVVKGSTPVSQKYTVTGLFSDGHSEDVTSQASFSVDDTRVGTFGGTTFTSTTTVGGATIVRARLGTTSTSTPLTVKLEQKVPDTTSDSASGASGATPLPSQPETKFDGPLDTDPTHKKPRIVYPNHGVMVPPNLGQLEIHFLPGLDSNTLFELAFTNAITDVRVYLRCYKPSSVEIPAGETRACIYTPAKDVWNFVAESNRGGQPLQLTLRATDDAGGPVSVSQPIALQFARSELKGALYYWTTTTPTGIVRYDFAGPATDKASPVLNASNINTSVSCVGCHALSRNGKKLVAEVNGQNDGRLALVDLSTFTPTSKTNLVNSGARLSTFESWNPDGSKFVGVYSDSGASTYNLLLFNGTTGLKEGEIAGTGDSTNPTSHPDWSADGKTIAYTSVGVRNTNQRNYKGAIKMVTAQTDGSWSAPVTVVPAKSGNHRYYPAIAPDSSFLVYNESTCPAGKDVDTHCNADTDPSATLWAAKLQANATPVKLTRANAPGLLDQGETNLTNSYPKWSPFVTRGTSSDSSRLMWVTFSSSRMYGLRKTIQVNGSSETTKGTLLWMAAVDPEKLAAGEDPSYPAFALPFQDLTTSNHIAQWAEYFVSNGCATVEEGCGSGGATCCNGLQCVQLNQDPPIPCSVDGACVCKPIPQCAPAFEKCSAAAPCCDGNRCLDAAGADCQGGDCTCRPPCSGAGQSCAGGSACCEGLRCNTAAGNVCQIVIN